VFVWNPGDGSDTVEGQGGTDRMLFNGANIAEKIDISANGGRVLFTRDIASITMDLNGVEAIDFNALGGADTITVNDLTGTDLKTINLHLESSPGSDFGDGAADSVTVNGTNGNDNIQVAGSGSNVTVAGLATVVNIIGSEGANDQLTVNGQGGKDVIDASRLAAGAINLTLNGGVGADLLFGSQGNDVILGGAGDDFLSGGAGQDSLDGGPGNNVVLQ
jgi:Ca2+-binding RTX toxin-like protein